MKRLYSPSYPKTCSLRDFMIHGVCASILRKALSSEKSFSFLRSIKDTLALRTYFTYLQDRNRFWYHLWKVETRIPWDAKCRKAASKYVHVLEKVFPWTFVDWNLYDLSLLKEPHVVVFMIEEVVGLPWTSPTPSEENSEEDAFRTDSRRLRSTGGTPSALLRSLEDLIQEWKTSWILTQN